MKDSHNSKSAIGMRQVADITNEACAWLAQLETGDLSKEDLAAFREWINRSPHHAARIREIAALSDDLASLTECIGPLVASSANEEPLLMRRRRQFFGGLPARVAMVIVAALVFSYLAYDRFIYDEAIHQFYATDIGEYKTVDLPDGSILKLNTNTAAEVHFDKNVREVRLAKGEAYFDVAENPSRPFTVYAGAHYARAIGTVFVVRLVEDQTELFVTEGVVEFANVIEAIPVEYSDGIDLDEGASGGAAKVEAQPVLVNAGYETSSLVALKQENTAKLSDRLRRQKLSWTEGLFDFSDAPLREVLEEVNRHTGMTVEFSDPAIEEVEFGGIFRIGDVDSLLDALPSVGIAVERVDQQTIRLRKAEQSEKT